MLHSWPSTFHNITIAPGDDERPCPNCTRRMWICDHRFRRIETLTGPTRLCCKLLKCPDRQCRSAGKTFSPRAEQELAPPKLAIDWELFAWIGHRRFARHWSVSTICAELADSFQIVFSPDAIEDYIHRYERMVAARHQDPVELVDVYANIPDVVLSIDGLQPEKGHETLYVVRELNATRVWFAAPLLSSTAAEIEALLVRARDIAAILGKPVRAWVSDKQDAFVTGIAKIFPQAPHRLCKIHFVRALAKETRADDGRVKVQLRKKVRGLRTIERGVLKVLRPPGSVVAADTAPSSPTSAPVPSQEPTAPACVAPEPAAASPAVPEATERRPAGEEPQAVVMPELSAAPSAPITSIEPPWAQLVLDYCAATRGILNDDQCTAKELSGLRMAGGLEAIKASLAACLADQKKVSQLPR